MLLNEPLLEVTRDILRDNLRNIVLPKKSIRITNEERVPAYAGDEFINIFGSECANENGPLSDVRKEVYSLKIGITRRFVGTPLDTTAEGLYTYDEELISKAKSSMSMRAYDIINLLDGQWAVPALIRQMDSLADYNFCVSTPMGYLGNSQLEEKGAEHFYTEAENENVVALFLELSFGGLQAYFNKY